MILITAIVGARWQLQESRGSSSNLRVSVLADTHHGALLLQSAKAFGPKRKAYKKPPPGAFPLGDERDVWARQGVTGHIYGVPNEYRHMRVPNDDSFASSSSGDASPSSSSSSDMKWASKMLADEGERAPLHGPSHDFPTADESETAAETGQQEPTRHRIRDAGLGSESAPLGHLRAHHRRVLQQRAQAAVWHDSRGAHHNAPVFARAIPIPPAAFPAAEARAAEPAVEESPIEVTVDRPPGIWATAVAVPAKAAGGGSGGARGRATPVKGGGQAASRGADAGVLSLVSLESWMPSLLRFNSQPSAT